MREERYMPSNGTEGDMFMSRWCQYCVKDSAPMGCGILGRSMAGVQPSQWVQTESGPVCTAFSDHKAESLSIIRDKRQIGLAL